MLLWGPPSVDLEPKGLAGVPFLVRGSEKFEEAYEDANMFSTSSLSGPSLYVDSENRSLLPERIWELPNMDEGGCPRGVKECAEDGGGGPAGVVEGLDARLLRPGVEGGLELNGVVKDMMSS